MLLVGPGQFFVKRFASFTSGKCLMHNKPPSFNSCRKYCLTSLCFVHPPTLQLLTKYTASLLSICKDMGNFVEETTFQWLAVEIIPNLWSIGALLFNQYKRKIDKIKTFTILWGQFINIWPSPQCSCGHSSSYVSVLLHSFLLTPPSDSLSSPRHCI